MFPNRIEAAGTIAREFAAATTPSTTDPAVKQPRAAKDDIDLRGLSVSASRTWLKDVLSGTTTQDAAAERKSELQRRAEEARRELERLADQARDADAGMASLGWLVGDDRGAAGGTKSTVLSAATAGARVHWGDD